MGGAGCPCHVLFCVVSSSNSWLVHELSFTFLAVLLSELYCSPSYEDDFAVHAVCSSCLIMSCVLEAVPLYELSCRFCFCSRSLLLSGSVLQVNHLFAGADGDVDGVLSFEEILNNHELFVGSEVLEPYLCTCIYC